MWSPDVVASKPSPDRLSSMQLPPSTQPSSRPHSPLLHLSPSAPSMPTLIANAKSSPILRSLSDQRLSEDNDGDEEESVSINGSHPTHVSRQSISKSSMLAAPGARAAGYTASPLSPSVNTPEPINYNRVRIDYAQHVESQEMTDVTNLIHQALQLRRYFVYRSHNRDEREFDVRVNPPFKPPSEDIPAKTEHSFKYVDGVYVAWEGVSDEPPLVSPTHEESDGERQFDPLSPPRHHAYRNDTVIDNGQHCVFTAPSRSDYSMSLSLLMDIAGSGPLKSFCHNRLYLLESRFKFHETLNSELEAFAQRAVPHRDFYNTRKIDGHVHHSACFNQKHLLRFIKYKLKTNPNEIVIQRDGKMLTLAQVFESLKLTPYDLSVDTLDMHADKTFHRFDKFNLKYNPIGESRLREIFLKYNNLTQGKYLAEITQQVFNDLETNKYSFAEYRLSIYGSAVNEWDVLSEWVVGNHLFHYNVRWMIQIPRLYQVYKAAGKISNFSEMVVNIFRPLFEVSVDPQSHPALHQFLQQCVGFDIVDDESVREKSYSDSIPSPLNYTSKFDPPYAYFAYYVYANLYTLNALRASKGFTTFAFRPHAGEAGDHEHLAATFLLAQSINHGLMLAKSPALQYLYYLAQVGISMSPLSNNLLFLEYDKNPFPKFFARGLNVALSTDDPLMIHVTKEPLVEEYSVAAQVWKLTSIDMSEIARNSVLQSGFEHQYKAHFLGNRYWVRGLEGNDIRQTNVPAIRVQFRQELLAEEMQLLSKYSDQPFHPFTESEH